MKEAKSFSFIIHDKHAEKAKDNCYKCHPGPKTKCFRDVMAKAGMACKDCHGTMKDIAKSIEKGRKPWLNEPSCGASKCHGADYAEENGKLFRQSKGHGGVFCSGCHGSPHAVLPTADYGRDNAQNVALQGYKGILDRCQVCHGVVPKGLGPHKMQLQLVSVTNDNVPKDGTKLNNPYPNPAKDKINIPFQIVKDAYVHLEIFDINGKLQITPLNQFLMAAEYNIPVDISLLHSGKYFYYLTTSNQKIRGAFEVMK